MIADALLGPMQATLNRNVGMSTPARKHARELDGRKVVIASPDINLTICFAFDQETVALSAGQPEDADCVISASPLTLLRLAGPEPESAFRESAASIEGDALVGQSFQKFLQFARPDLEEELSRVVGDIAAHQLMRGFQSFMDWGRRSSQMMAQSTAEYLQEESRDLPSAAEARHFMDDVDELREQADRLDARLRRLEKDGPF